MTSGHEKQTPEEAKSKLCEALCNILMNHVGETGQSEGAVEVLNRKLKELATSRLLNERAVTALKGLNKWHLKTCPCDICDFMRTASGDK